MRKFFSILFFICLLEPVTGQVLPDSNIVDVAGVDDSISIKKRSFLFIDSNHSATTANLQSQPFRAIASYQLKNGIPVSWVSKTAYLQFRLINSADTLQKIYFLPGFSFSSIFLYKVMADGTLIQLPDESMVDGFQPIRLNGGEQATFIAALRFSRTTYNSLSPQLIQANYLKKYQTILYSKSDGSLITGYLLSGILLMMIFFTAANYLLSGKKEFLYNCCYSFCMFLLIFLTTYFNRRAGIFCSLFMGYLDLAFLVTGTIFYIAFTRKFLGTKENYFLLNRILLTGERGLFLFLLLFTYVHFFTNNFWLENLLEISMKLVALCIGILYIIIAFLRRNKLMNYLAIGNAVLIIFSIISFLFIIYRVPNSTIFTDSMFYYEIGIVAELISFLLGLTYKNRIELIRGIKEQEGYKLESEKQAFETRLAVIKAQQEERNRISADMHDDLGAGVTAIRLYSELAKRRTETQNIPEIEKISSSANELLNNMNAIIWTMNSNNDSLGNMVAYIRSYSLEYFENTGVNCYIDLPDNLPNIEVGGKIRRNVYLVMKETLNNVLKHARATEVHITLKRVPDGLALYIQDNGIGIDLGNLRQFGNGLKNMRKRMEDVGVEFSIENSNGTLVTLHRKVEF